MSQETKRYHVRNLLTVTTGRLLTKRLDPDDNGISALYDLLEWLTGEAPFTQQLPRFGKECEPWLLRWFPELGLPDSCLAILDEKVRAVGGDLAVDLWLTKLIESGQVEEYYDVPRVPPDDHESKDPWIELIAERGTDEGLGVIEIPAESDRPSE